MGLPIVQYIIATLEDLSVSSQKLADRAVTGIKIALGGVATENIADEAVDSDKIAADAVGVVHLDQTVDLLTRLLPVRAPCVVVTTTNITVVGGAPKVVDTITLVSGDRVLCIGQTDTKENGIRQVDVLGTGANGTWGRAPDADEDGDLFYGVEVFIQKGAVGGAKSYRMATAGIPTIGVSAITWTEVTTTPADDSVTFAKIQNIATDRLIGRDTAGTGDPEEIAVGGGLEFTGSAGIQRSALTGDVTAPAGSNATSIAANSVALAKLVNAVAQYDFVGRNTAGAGAWERMTQAQARAGLVDGYAGYTSFGTYSAAPGSPKNGDVHYCTDSPIIRCREGGVWVDRFQGLTGRPTGTIPLAATFGTLVNSPVLSDVGGLIAVGAVDAGPKIRSFSTTHGLTAPYRITAYIEPWLQDVGSGFIQCGIQLTDGTKYIMLSISSRSGEAGYNVLMQYWSNPTTFSANPKTLGIGNIMSRTILGVRLADDGTNRRAQYLELDGTWIDIDTSTSPNTDHITAPAYYGGFLYNQNTVYPSIARYFRLDALAGATGA